MTHRPSILFLAVGLTVKYCAASGNVNSTYAWLSRRWTTWPPGMPMPTRAGRQRHVELGKHHIGVR